jgi:hypothetical protein
VYLYTADWSNAAIQATAILNNTNLYGLTPGLNDVFSANSNEAIWQLQQSNQTFPYNATGEGFWFVPSSQTTQPDMYLTPALLNAFEDSDLRRTTWVDSTVYAGTTYYYPYKYRIGAAQATPGGMDSAYYMVLRLGEQYLIRAEAEANGAGGGISAAISDMNVIRLRAGLSPYAGPGIADSVLKAIYHERQVELFAELGHRWLDLKRWGTAT